MSTLIVCGDPLWSSVLCTVLLNNNVNLVFRDAITPFQDFCNTVAPHEAVNTSALVIDPSLHTVKMWAGFGLDNRLLHVASRVQSARQAGYKQLIHSRLTVGDVLHAEAHPEFLELRKSCTIACVVDDAHRHTIPALIPSVDRYCVEPDNEDELTFSVAIHRFSQSLAANFLNATNVSQR